MSRITSVGILTLGIAAILWTGLQWGKHLREPAWQFKKHERNTWIWTNKSGELLIANTTPNNTAVYKISPIGNALIRTEGAFSTDSNDPLGIR